MRPYGGLGDAQQHHFNRCLTWARNVVECTFGHLRARWQCLIERLAIAEENITLVRDEMLDGKADTADMGRACGGGNSERGPTGWSEWKGWVSLQPGRQCL